MGDTGDLPADSESSDFTPRGFGKYLSDDGEYLVKDNLKDGRGEKPKTKRKRGSKNGSPEVKKKSLERIPGGDEVDVKVVLNLQGEGKAASGNEKKKKKGAVVASSGGPSELITRMKNYSLEVMECLMVESVERGIAAKVLGVCGKYEEILMQLVAENERLRGRLEGVDQARNVVADGFAVPAPVAPLSGTRMTGAVPGAGVPSAGAVGAVTVPAQPPVVKPVDTWSVVVKGKEGATSEEVVRKVVKEVGPTLGVRVHDIRPVRGGGAVIRTPSVAEREKVAANAKFTEVGLEVSVKDKLGPRVVVQRVLSEISTEEFMSDLYEMNLKETMTMSSYKKSVRLVSSPWKQSPDGHVNVILEVTSGVMERFIGDGVYIKWFRFVARPQDPVRACFRCLGFDHEVRKCKFTEDVCRRCGLTGHLASQCCNDVRCRNCALKGYPTGHMMLSSACPIVASKIAVANSRH